MSGERSRIHQPGAGLGEQAFVGIGKFFVKFARQNQTKNRVAEIFEPLVVRRRRVGLVRDGRMRERETQQVYVAKNVGETILKCGEVRHEI